MEPVKPEPRPVVGWKRLIVGRHPRRTLLRAAVLAAVLLVVFKFALLPVRIRGISMEPTCHDGSVDLVNRLAYWRSSPRRGDIVAVALSHPQRWAGPHVMYLKRVIGLPGETIAIHQGVVFINGQPLDEPYVRRRDNWEEPPRKLAPDEYYLIGDNRGMPQAFHEYGHTTADRIIGKALW